MKIKDIDLGKHPILLAPMEDVTDPAFRHFLIAFHLQKTDNILK